MIKVIVVIGTRPETIKMSPVIRELKRHPDRIETVILTTGQHREMLQQVLEIFDILPDYDLDIMTQNQSLTLVTSKVLRGMEDIIKREKPSMILVQGDTTTAFAASLAGFYHKVKIGHVEAGLRTKNKYYPFPEEVNRTLVSALADLHFAPTKWASDNLIAQGIPKQRILITGNTVIDALFYVLKKDCELNLEINFNKRKVILVTAHRRENFGDPLRNICEALRLLLDKNSEIEIIYPVHFNPNIRDVVMKSLDGIDRMHLLDPLDYFHFVHLMNHSYLILTDSGGIQEEAPSLGKPVLVLRNETERPEAVEAGTVKLVGTDVNNIVENVERLLLSQDAYQEMSQVSNPYGDGCSSIRIAEGILEYFKNLKKWSEI